MKKVNNFKSSLWQKIFIFTYLFFVNIGFQFYTTKAQTTQNYNWKNVAIGGGGFVSAVITSKTEQNLVYARTDVGGAYRWDSSSSSWVSLLDWVSEDEVGYLGVESLAIDPQSANKVYMLAGISYFNNGKTAILRSNDYGKTFTIIDVTSQFKAHGNGMGRQAGEKLAVDPNNSNILYCGTRWNGLFKSVDAGTTWTRLNSLNVTTTSNENGISFVLLDGGSVSGGATQRIIVGVSRNGTTNLYRSDDGGQSFSAISGAPNTYMPHRAVLANNGNLFVTYANGAGPHGNTSGTEPMDNGQIWRYSISSGQWTNITPSGFNRAFGGISVDPNNPNRIVASTINTYLPQYKNTNNGNDVYGDRIFLSTNGGSSWIDVVDRGFTLDPDGITWVYGHSIHWAGSIEFDPFNVERVWVTSGNGIFVNDNISSGGIWRFRVKGIEETVPLALESIPNGPVISVIGDYDGFRHNDINQYAPIHNPQMGTTTGLAVASQNTNKIVRVGNAMYYSNDMGSTWTQNNMNGTKGKVALSANGNVILHAPAGSSVTYKSTNNGGSWSAVSGLNVNEAMPVGDPVNSNKFYAYNSENGAVMVSTNGGDSFSQFSSVAGGGTKVIRVAPGMEGHVWIALNNGGLARSTNSGQSFSAVSGISNCGAIGFGVAAPGSNYPAIYIWGTINNIKGVYRSTDQAVSWVRVNDNNHEYGGPANGQFVQGDRNVFGRVYMSTAGRGIVYGDPDAVCSTAITPYVKINEGEWQQTSNVSIQAGSSLQFGPQPVADGSWAWSGPNNFSANTREVFISNIQSGQSGNYIATYTDSNSCSSTYTFSVIVAGTIIVRARGTQGTETIELRADNVPIATWTLTNTYQNYSANGTGTITVHFTNDNDGRDVQIDNISVGGVLYESENQQENTGVWTDKCGGSNSEWLNCNGFIRYATVAGNSLKSGISIDAENNFSGMIIYPNPSPEGKFRLDIPWKNEKVNILIFDMQGKLVYKQTETEKKQVLVNSNLGKGLYVIRVEGQRSALTGKLLVN